MLSLELCDRAAMLESAVAGASEVVDPATAGSAGDSCVMATSALAASETSCVTAAIPALAATEASGADSDSRRTGIRWPLRLSTRRLIILAAIVLGMRIFVGEASVVPTASMEGTILVGDHLFMDKLLYGPEIPLVHWRLPALKTIHRGDIIVFRYPKDVTETFLKRVTAIGGDRLEIKNGVLYVNSQAVR